MPVYAVTEASGPFGGLAVEQLLASGVPPSDVVAVVCDQGAAVDVAVCGVRVRKADFSRPRTLGSALAGVDRLLLVSNSDPEQRVVRNGNVIGAARTAGVSRIAYTSILNADQTTSPLAGEHRESERALRAAGVPFTLLRNGLDTEDYTDRLSEYLDAGEITGAAGNGRISAATRRDYAAAAAVALLRDEGDNRVYELGGPAFGLAELAHVISEVTGVQVTYRDLDTEDYLAMLRHSGLDEASARFVAAVDASTARGDLETSSADLANLLGRAATSLTEVVRTAHTPPKDAVADRAAGPVVDGMVARRDLTGRLDGPARVTVVSAPAGSGKTVLLRSWIGQAGLADRAGWVTAGRDERNPQSFWLSVLSALRATGPGSVLVRAVSAAPDLDGWMIVEGLLTDLALLAERLWLVVDDVHELGPVAQRQLELLIMRAPTQLRFVLATRHDVRLSLHRLRLEGQLGEIRGPDLRFSLAEAGKLFAAAGVRLDEPTVAVLHERTEGGRPGCGWRRCR